MAGVLFSFALQFFVSFFGNLCRLPFNTHRGLRLMASFRASKFDFVAGTRGDWRTRHSSEHMVPTCVEHLGSRIWIDRKLNAEIYACSGGLKANFSSARLHQLFFSNAGV